MEPKNSSYEFYDMFKKVCGVKEPCIETHKIKEQSCLDNECTNNIIGGGTKSVISDFKCKYCNKSYKSSSGLRSHEFRKHNDEKDLVLKSNTKFNNINNKYIHKCDFCDKVYANKDLLDKHKIDKHKINQPVYSDNSSLQQINLEKLDNDWFKMQGMLGGSSNPTNLENLDNDWIKMQEMIGGSSNLTNDWIKMQEMIGGSKSKPIDTKLYDKVRQLANKKFKSPSGIYRSSWMVREYKKRGGKYSGTKDKSSGLKRWFKEDWVDLNRPKRNSSGKVIGYAKCGRKSSLVKGKYPLCRPSKSVNKKSPRTYKSITKKSLEKAKRDKSRIRNKGSIKFGGYYSNLRPVLLHNLEDKYTCPICKRLIHGNVERHLERHQKRKLEKQKKEQIEINLAKIKQMGGYHSNLRKELISNLKKKYTCPICKNEILGNVHDHIKSHEKIPKINFQDKPLPNIPTLTFFSERNDSLPKIHSLLKLHDSDEHKISERSDSLPKMRILPKISERSDSLPKMRILPKISERSDSLQKIHNSDWDSTTSEQNGSGAQFYGKKGSVMIKVPSAVKKAALYSFKLKKLGFKGGLETGWKRAKQLATKSEIAIEDLKYIRAFFARHIFTSYPSYLKWVTNGKPKDKFWHNKRGIIAILIWGGLPAIKWVNSKSNINLLNKHYNKNYVPLKLK